jgi:membrane associated rhomboid family serine protease
MAVNAAVAPADAGRSTAPAPDTQRHAMATGALVAAQVLVWIVIVFCYREQEWLQYALVPEYFSLPRLLISPFVHVDPYHLGFNLAVLWLFGSGLERAIGSIRFLAIYLAAAWFAGLMHWAVTVAAQMDMNPDAAGAAAGAVGSSGAIAGILGAYSVRLPHRPLLLPFPTHWRIHPAPLLGAWLAWEFARAVLHTARGTGAGIGSWAHFAGFVFGLSAAYLLGLHALSRAEQLSHTAREAFRNRDYVRAAAAWTALLRSHPDQQEARLGLVRARLAAKERPAAELAAKEGLVRAVRRDEIGRALSDYRLYQELLPELRLPFGVRYRLGCWLAEAGDDQAAVAALMRAAHEDEATPGAASALFRAGEIAADRLQDPRRARLAWQRILLDYSESVWRDAAYARLGELGGGRQ